MTSEERATHVALTAALKCAALQFAHARMSEEEPRLYDLCVTARSFGEFCVQHSLFAFPSADTLNPAVHPITH